MNNRNTNLTFPDPNSVPATQVANTPSVLAPIDILEVDHSYQRALIPGHVNKMVTGFDKRVCANPTAVHRPDGRFVLIDGQQRVEAARRKGYQYIWINLIELHTPADEARLFVNINTSQRNLKPAELLKACVVQGNNVAVAIEKAFNGNGRGMSALPDFGDKNLQVKTVARSLEAWGNVPIYKHFDLSDKEERTRFKNGERTLNWAVEAGMGLIRLNHPAHKVYSSAILGSLIWIHRSHAKTSLSKVKATLAKAESPEQLRYVITRTKSSAGGSRRDLHGVRLAYWANQTAAKPFITLEPHEWWLLWVNDGIEVWNDPAVLLPEGKNFGPQDPNAGPNAGPGSGGSGPNALMAA